MINWIQKKRNKKGFTLIELIVVIAILGILAAIAIPRLTGTRKTANDGVIASNLRMVQSGIELYAASNNISADTLPTATHTQALILASIDAKNLVGPGTTAYAVAGGVAEAAVDATIDSDFKGKTVILDGNKLKVKP